MSVVYYIVCSVSNWLIKKEKCTVVVAVLSLFIHIHLSNFLHLCTDLLTEIKINKILRFQVRISVSCYLSGGMYKGYNNKYN